jgi:hypothetical protein
MKHSEGGITLQAAKDIAKRCGIEIRTGSSGYVGHFGIYVKTEDKRKLARLARELGIG